MHTLIEHLVTQSVYYSLIAVALVTFLESLMLVGLILPGTVMMAGLGTLIGNGEINFWQAWVVGVFGCLLGDWISFWIGWRFKKLLYRWSLIKKNKELMDKIERALHRHSMFTVLVGRFIGPTRPLVPMVAGMLNLQIARFIIPNIIGCLFWPLLYFLPGILAGAAIDIPVDEQSYHFKWLLLVTMLILWLAVWFYWRLWCNRKTSHDSLMYSLSREYLFWLVPLTLGAVIVALICHPLMPIYSKILFRVVSR